MSNATPSAPAPANPTAVGIPDHLRFAAPIEFAVGDAVPADGQSVPVELVARTTEPVVVWWADAPIVHDFAGVEHKDKIVLDWLHNSDELIGFADSFDSRKGNFVVKGNLTPLHEGDRAHRIIAQSKAGIPFEASISWLPLEIDYLPNEAETQLNGQTIAGPLMIVRRWSLLAVAICPHGADGGTVTQFSRSDRESLRSIPVTTFGAPDMPDPTTTATNSPNDSTPATEDATPAVEGQESPDLSITEEATADRPAAEYVETFGKSQGSIYFAEGKPFLEAATAHIKFQREQLAELTNAKAAAPKGKAVEFSNGENASPAAKSIIRFRK